MFMMALRSPSFLVKTYLLSFDLCLIIIPFVWSAHRQTLQVYKQSFKLEMSHKELPSRDWGSVCVCFRKEFYPKATPLELYSKAGRIKVLTWR